MVLERNPDYWDKDQHLSRSHHPEAAARRAVALRQPAIGRGRCHLGRRSPTPTISRRPRRIRSSRYIPMRDPAPRSHAFNTKVAPLDDVRVRQALVMALDRKKMSQAITNGLARPATNPYGDGSWVKCKDDGALPEDLEKAKALIKEYGKPVEFKMLVTATPRGRANRSGAAAVLEAGRRQHGNRAGRPGDHSAARLHAPVPGDAMADRRSRRSRHPDVRQFPHRQPGSARQLLQPGARQAARARAGHRRPGQARSRIIARSAGSSTRKRSGSGPSRTPTTRCRAPR